MDFLKTHVFLAFFIAVAYFISKSMIKRIYKDDSIETKQISKDSFLIFVVSYLSLVFRSNIFMHDNIKTQVFTSEPNF
jgi:hypothetical protein